MLSSSEPARTFLVFDGHAVIYRAYHAFPNLTDPEGRLVNAVYGFSRILLKTISDFQPDFVAVAFDHPKPTFRHEAFTDYKAHREAMPEDLRPQIELIKEVVDILNMPKFELEGYEADDLVGTLAAKVTAEHIPSVVDRTVIVSGDSDLLQLVTDKTQVFIPQRGKFGKDTLYVPTTVEKKYGFPPARLTQLKALTGDSSDNIPGVPGIGPKTAVKLLSYADSLEALFELVEKIQAGDGDVLKDAAMKKAFSKRIVNLLSEHKEQAEMSQQLAIIDTKVPIEFDLEKCRLQSYDRNKAAAVFEDLSFKSLVRLLPEDAFEAGVQSALF